MERIDWTPFFQTWELAGPLPRHPGRSRPWAPRRGALFDDAQALLRPHRPERLLTARGVFGFFPASVVGDDIEVYGGTDRREQRSR